MTRPLRAVHQFHPGSAYGDGVTNGMLFTRGLLRELGLASEIYVEHIAPELAGQLQPYRSFADSDDALLLVHHSLGHDLEAWLEGLRCPKLLIYHNITPAEFFPPGSALRHYATKGRRQLHWLKGLVAGGIGDSELNTNELREAGFERTQTLPLLFCSEDKLAAPWDRTSGDRYRSACTILFVGRIVENKRQLELVEVFHRFVTHSGLDARLVLAGGISSEDYRQQILQQAAAYGLEGQVLMTGKIPDEELLALYRAADLFLCLSDHEGFGIPLIEAQLFGLPVVAFDSSSVRHTLDGAGILVKEKQPEQLAALLTLLMTQRGLRRGLLLRQQQTAARFSRPRLKRELAACLDSFGFVAPQAELSAAAEPPALRYQLEGPFDSSYSLALLNREMAKALEQLYPGQVALYSTEGGGDFEPDRAFLASQPEVARLWQRSRLETTPLVVGRNLYPPRVTDMGGAIRLLTSYGWEESGFPQAYVEQFNQQLDGVTVMSRFVQKVLLDAGVTVPVQVAGVGTDHIMNVTPSPCPVALGSGFKFLHVSSCFPRKGADLLLEAYFQSFGADDEVTLVIKTFPNPHNRIEQELARYRRSHPQGPRVVLINEDLDDGVLRTLYQSCHCLVAPSRGEGFGLPPAEAMLHDLPVIVTAYGGQSDFCTEQTAWLVDYDFAYAQTHMGLSSSVWAEPRVAHLAERMQEVYRLHQQDPQQLRIKTEAARRLISEQFRWADCAQRFDATVTALQQAPIFEEPTRLGWVSSWQTKCGIASYSSFLLEQLDPAWLTPVIFANRDEPLTPDKANVHRCWQDFRDHNLNELFERIMAEKIDLVVVQFNFGFFNLASLAELFERLLAERIEVVLFLHSAADAKLDGEPVSLGSIVPALSRISRIMVHNVADLNILKGFGLVENVTLFPQGVQLVERLDREQIKQERGLTGQRVIGAYGFLLPHKGIVELIEAFGLLCHQQPDLHLLLVNALYPHPASEETLHRCQETIQRLEGVAERVTLVNEYLEDKESLTLLAACDLIVYPYQQTQESSSAAVRLAVASQRPIACTPLEIFNDVREFVHQLPGTTPELLAQGITTLLQGGEALLMQKADSQQRWIEQHAWPRLGERLTGILRGLRAERWRRG